MLPRGYVPQLVGKGKPDHRVQGEPDLMDRVIQGDLEAEGWREPSLDSIMADFIYLNTAVDGESVEGDFMAPVRVRDDEIGEETAPRSIPFFIQH